MDRLTILSFLMLTIGGASGADVCTVGDPVASCECYFDGLHFAALCARTGLEALPSARDLPKDLELLDVSNNRIATLRFDDAAFESKLMRVFRASRNRIAAVPATFLAGMPHLTALDLSHNEITQLDASAFRGVASLHNLDLSFNGLHQLPAGVFLPLRCLRSLDVSYNDLGEQFRAFASLNASGLGINDAMVSLKMNRLNLTALPESYFEKLSLESLSISDNALEEVPGLPASLTTLDLSGNHFRSIAARDFGLFVLTELKLNRMPLLEDIGNYAFYNLLSLEALEIRHCPKLTSLNDKAFGVLVEKEEWNLTRISLSGNSLRKLNDTYFHLFNKVREVDLSSNPWICDCGVTWFQLVRSKLINERSMRCVAPKRLRNREVMELNEEVLLKCDVQSNIRVQKILTTVICILVVLLLGVIMYLIYLVPYKGNRSERMIGQESPYSTIVVQDELY